MIQALIHLLKSGSATQTQAFPNLPEFSRGLPTVSGSPCASTEGCTACTEVCPTQAIKISPGEKAILVALDRGLCIACNGCVEACPTGTIAADRRTTVAVRSREDLIHTNQADENPPLPPNERPFSRSLHVREVSTGDSASDMEALAANNPIFDSSRFGIHFVASPRHADALLVTGPVARAMHEPLRRCYDAMAEPRLVIAVGASAISGALHRGGYAEANGVDPILPVDVYVPGSPPHPWYILHGLLLAMGRSESVPRRTLASLRSALRSTFSRTAE